MPSPRRACPARTTAAYEWTPSCTSCGHAKTVPALSMAVVTLTGLIGSAAMFWILTQMSGATAWG